jgi:predicted dienelactone hydrolase
MKYPKTPLHPPQSLVSFAFLRFESVIRWLLRVAIALSLMTSPPAFAHPAHTGPPSIPGADAPELAAMGPDGVGFRTVTLIHKRQPDFQAVDAKTGAVPPRDRKLVVDIWYPARVPKGAKPVTYRGTLFGEPPRPPVAFTQEGLAVLNAKPLGRAHPLVILSHGYSNAPAVMTWLTENLASKGYVVAGIHHEDPDPYTVSADKRAAPNYDRPQDIAFVTAQLRVMLGAEIDPAQVALIGYSQGGYGVLTAGGASLDPEGPNMALVAGGWLKKYARGTAGASEIAVPGVKAIIALAPGGGFPKSAWGAEGLAAITAPLLLIQGDADPVVDYKTGALAVFAGAVRSDRYLLTYKQAGHAVALNPAPAGMRGSVWDMDWLEDAINLHFITAFLAVRLRGEESRTAYLNVPVENSDDGVWAAPDDTPWGAYSPGEGGVTMWKGFQRRHARGMELRHLGVGR